MVWNYLFDASKIDFDVQPLDQIEQKKNHSVEHALQDAKDLCSAIDASGNSLLHFAAKCDNDRIIPFLIKSRAKINQQDEHGATALLLATRNDFSATIKVLLEYDADIYISDEGGVNPLQLALRSSAKIAKLFLHRVSNDCSSNSTEIAKRLVKIGCPLRVAVLLENVDVTTCMLSEGCALDVKDSKSGKTALHVAVENADLDNVKKLVFLGADVNVKDASGKMPLAMINDFSGSNKTLQILKTLIRADTEINACDNDGYMQARSIFESGTARDVEIALESQLHCSGKSDEHGQTIVHYLAKNCNAGMSCACVIEDFRLSNLNARDEDGLTAMHHAMYAGNSRFVKYLIEEKADFNIANHKGVTPFLHCVDSASESTLKNRVECVKILLRNEAHPDILLGHYFKIHSSKSLINRDVVLLEPVVAMLALWKALGKPFNREILREIEEHCKLKEYFDKCTSELARMQTERVYRFTTLFNIVAGNGDVEKFIASYSSLTRIILPSKERALEKYRSISIFHDILNDKIYEMKWAKFSDGRLHLVTLPFYAFLLFPFILTFITLFRNNSELSV